MGRLQVEYALLAEKFGVTSFVQNSPSVASHRKRYFCELLEQVTNFEGQQHFLSQNVF